MLSFITIFFVLESLHQERIKLYSYIENCINTYVICFLSQYVPQAFFQQNLFPVTFRILRKYPEHLPAKYITVSKDLALKSNWRELEAYGLNRKDTDQLTLF